MFCLPFIMKVLKIYENPYINITDDKLSLTLVHWNHHLHDSSPFSPYCHNFQQMEKKPWFKSRPAIHGPFQVPLLLLTLLSGTKSAEDMEDTFTFQVLGVGCFLMFMVPFACALFPQNVSKTSSNFFFQLDQHLVIFHELCAPKYIGAFITVNETPHRWRSPQSTCDKKTPRRIPNCKRSESKYII